ncbi:beta-mannosidase [Rhodococcus sp. DMU1]|uniref:beta-mannosidase n=1 Tax=Rhodococcus sp. DMU1 TaxID=2722825 RepID=UPI00143E126B|nr:beta-mannosidase [Rhodococcus sp. DMU1]QIX51915.1 beta-mannosidase [Rhodococcus sp. DMU1]
MRAAAVVVACLVGAAACASPPPPDPPPPPPPARVTVDGRGLILDGKPWWPTGLNAYQLASDWDVNGGCGAQVDLDAYFSSLPPSSLTRFNAFQALALNRVTGTLDFAAIDAVFAAAERHGQLVMPVLSPQDGACGNELYKDRAWYEHGWTTRRAPFAVSYRDWVRLAVDRWRVSPALAAWDLLGEPEPGVCGDAACSLPRRSCPPDSAQLLRAWTDAVGRIVRETDPRHPISLGLIGGDQCGSAGDGYAQLAKSPYVDVLQYHDYDEAAWLPVRLGQVTKPILVAELGIEAGSCLPLPERAERVDAALTGYRETGAAGALLWAFVPDPRGGECTYDIGPGDPAFDVLARHGSY